MVEELKLKQALVEQADAAFQSAEARVATAQAMVKEAEAGRIRTTATYELWASNYKRPADPAIQFAAALISADDHRGEYPAHAAKARAGSGGDALLARNLDHVQ